MYHLWVWMEVMVGKWTSRLLLVLVRVRWAQAMRQLEVEGLGKLEMLMVGVMEIFLMKIPKTTKEFRKWVRKGMAVVTGG
jgi:hypothetical protein